MEYFDVTHDGVIQDLFPRRHNKMHMIDLNAVRLDNFERRISELEKKLSPSPPAKPKTAEEWLAGKRFISDSDIDKRTLVVFTDKLPANVLSGLFGTPKNTPIPMNVRVWRSMFMLALDKVLRDCGEIE